MGGNCPRTKWSGGNCPRVSCSVGRDDLSKGVVWSHEVQLGFSDGSGLYDWFVVRSRESKRDRCI